jgi:hypothetical protein
MAHKLEMAELQNGEIEKRGASTFAILPFRNFAISIGTTV